MDRCSLEKINIPSGPLGSRARPFLKWAGGKRKLVPLLMSHLPDDLGQRRYIEPFLGAGSLFFEVAPKRALLSDANPALIAVYESIRDHAEAVRRELRGHIERHSRSHYYQTREIYNRRARSAAQAARFIYLNMTCFNGIFRVNTRGQFNVPKGSKDKLTLPSVDEFHAVAAALAGAVLAFGDFAECLADVAASDFIYLDPPYPALNDTAYFAHYTSDRFGAESQERLANVVKRAHNKGARFLMSNADVESVRALYAEFDVVSVPVRRFVSCNGERLHASELLIRNY
jgi:DNA adenine methylase